MLMSLDAVVPDSDVRINNSEAVGYNIGIDFFVRQNDGLGTLKTEAVSEKKYLEELLQEVQINAEELKSLGFSGDKQGVLKFHSGVEIHGVPVCS